MGENDELGEWGRSQESVGDFLTTRRDLAGVFARVGLKPGVAVMVHAAMKGLGYVVNGPHDVIDAVFDCIGGEGTMVVSSNTSQLTDPAEWKAPAVPTKWVDVIRENMRPFDPKTTLIRGRGILPLAFLLSPGVQRSAHPVKSVAALGKMAGWIASEHPFDESEGVGSPVHKLYLLDGVSLLVGVSLAHCTVIHLAEFLADVPYLDKDNFRALLPDAGGKNRFVPLKKYPVTSRYFPKLEDAFKTQGFMSGTRWHGTEISLLDVRKAVDFTVGILKKDPEYLLRPEA